MGPSVPDLEVSLFFPVYKDEATVRTVAMQGIALLEGYAGRFEIVIVDDGSPDRSGEIADELAREYPDIVRVIHHGENGGYGKAVKTGMAACRYEWICMVDGDNEYAVADLRKMLEIRAFYRLIIAFRYRKMYSTSRIFISFVYNFLLRILFRTPYRDISTGIRTIHRSVLQEVALTSDSPFIGAELAIKTMLCGFPVGELGIQTFPRTFGSGSSTSMKNILLTIRDMLRVRREIFSSSYLLPEGREREAPRDGPAP
jgi:glycosyltransferase involved in cell wall biosynthesis